MKPQSLLLKTSLFFLIVLFHSALTRLAADPCEPEPDRAAASDRAQMRHLGFDGTLAEFVEYTADQVPDLFHFKPVFELNYITTQAG